jgi:hypothetical protein
MSVLAFCPWLHIGNTYALGSIEVVPYRRGQLPGPSGSDSQRLLDSITEPYLAFANHPIEYATLFKQSGRNITDDLNEDEVRDLYFRLEILAFCALSQREYFIQGPMHYWNRENFTLIVQRFDHSSGGVGIATRRRDGGGLSYVTRQAYRVRKPDHVAVGTLISV